MENKMLLENVPLTPKYIVLNPNDLKVFDNYVGHGNRSKVIRKLIREFNKRENNKDAQCVADNF